MELVSNPSRFMFFGLSGISYKFFKLKHNGFEKRPPPEMYTIDTLKKVNCTFVLEVAFRARSLLEPPTLAM